MRLSDAEIFDRISKAMQPQAQPVVGKLSPTTMESIIQKAKQRRGTAPEITAKPKGI